jgi:Fe-S-cluster containining protein
VTGFDLVRIVDKLEEDPWAFAELAHAAEIESAPHTMVFLFNEKGKMEERLLTLQRRKNNYCIFSRHSQGCAIWGFHPMVCRAYPFAYKEGGKIGYTKNFVCPRPWEKSEWPENVRNILEVQNKEMEEYNKIVREWNATRAKKEGEKEREGKHALHSPEHPMRGAEKAFWKFLMEKSREKMKEWEKEGARTPEEMGSNGPKRGFMEPDWLTR